LQWGRLSDKIGRRPVLLIGVFTSTGANFLFGFSRNFAWAVSARLLWGILNANPAVAKAYLSEVNQPETLIVSVSTVVSMTPVSSRFVMTQIKLRLLLDLE
jgi:MFS family permease